MQLETSTRRGKRQPICFNTKTPGNDTKDTFCAGKETPHVGRTGRRATFRSLYETYFPALSKTIYPKSLHLLHFQILRFDYLNTYIRTIMLPHI